MFSLVQSEQIMLLALVLARVAPLVMLAPIFGSRSLPLHLRLLLAMTLSIMIAVLRWDEPLVMMVDTPTLLLALSAEALTGVSLGLAVLAAFHGAELAGRLIGGSSGLVMNDGAGGDLLSAAPVPAQLLYLIALAVFVTMGGHRLVVSALLDSFQSLPPGTGLRAAHLTDMTTSLLAASYQLAVRAAMPVIAALLIANLTVGILSRGAGQMNSLMVGFGLNLFVLLAALFFALAALAYLLGNGIETFLRIWQQLI